MRAGILVVAILALFVFTARPSPAQNVPTGITVSGTAEVRVRPDTAFVSFGVVTQAETAAEAARENATLTNRVIDAIVGFGVPRTDIQTTQYSVSPVMDYKRTPPVTVGYQVTNQVRVRLRDISRIGALIDTAIGAGANNVQGVTFTVADETAVRSEALIQAIANARAKAQVMANTLGVRLGRVVSASESTGFVPRPMYDMAAARAEAAPTPIIPGDVEVTANVTLVYSIL